MPMPKTVHIYTPTCTTCGVYGVYGSRIRRWAAANGARVLERRTDISAENLNAWHQIKDQNSLDDRQEPVVMFTNGDAMFIQTVTESIIEKHYK